MATRTWISTSSTDFNVTTNWSASTVPVTGDTIIFNSTGTAGIDANLGQSALTGITLLIYANYTGTIGSVTTPLSIGATSAQIGLASNGAVAGGGSGRINLDFGSSNCTTVVTATSATSADTGLAPVRIKGGGATSKLIVYTGRVDGATNTVGDTASFASVDIPNTGLTPAPIVYLASGCTLTTVNQSVGTLTMNSAGTMFTQSGGTAMIQGTGAWTTIVAGGTLYYNSTGTVTTASANGGGTLTFAQDTQAKTVTNPIKAYPGCTVNVDNGSKGSITHSVALQGCRLADVTYKTWLGSTVTLS
jgi:hypothetical protein